VCFVIQAQNELIEAMKAETFYEGDNPLSHTDEDHGVSTMMEHENKQQEDDQSQNTVITDFEGLPVFVVSSVHRNCTAAFYYSQ